MIRTIAARLERLPIERLRDIAYPVTEWMVGIAERLYGDAAEVLPSLWDRLVQALVLWDHDRRHRPDRSWAGDALNAPVGKLVDLLLKDPAKNNLEAGAGYPAHWTARIDQLLALPGDLRRQALVMISFQWRGCSRSTPLGRSGKSYYAPTIRAMMVTPFGKACSGRLACLAESCFCG